MKSETAMSPTWTMSVNGLSYGPYTATQMEAFAVEGRLAAHALVARPGEDKYHPAGEDSDLARLVQPAPVPAPAPAKPVFFTAEGDLGPQSFGRLEDDGRNECTHYIIVADMKSGSIAGLEQEIFNLGPAYPVFPQTWIVQSEMTINAIRNKLVQKLGKLDKLFIADATHDKAAWFNFGPEAESRIRRLWQKTPDQSPLSRAS